MPATSTTSLSPSATWGRCQEEKKPECKTTSWRERAASGESRGDWRARKEEKTGVVDLSRVCGGDWRAPKQEKTEEVDQSEKTEEGGLSRVYGDVMPAEWKLVELYDQFKSHNNELTTWLVESVYPDGKNLPGYITLSSKQSRVHDKYEIIVNKTTELARQIQTVPPAILTLLDRLIPERTEYTYWMSRKSHDDLANPKKQTHGYYVEVLKEVRTILAERTELATQAQRQQRRLPSLSKRKASISTFHGPDRQKAAKTQLTAPAQKHDLNAARYLKLQSWRRVIADSCEKTEEAKGGKSMDDVSAQRVAASA